jgi:hypothetical protein
MLFRPIKFGDKKIEEIYVTIFEKSTEQIRLINLLEEWGFEKYGIKKSTGEIVLVKNFDRTQEANLENPKKTFPFISNKSKEDMNEAILSRSLTVDLTMTPTDKIDRMSAILGSILPEYSLEAKVEALDFLKTVKDEVSLNMRMLIMVTKMRSSYPSTWRDMAKYMVKS